MSDETKIICRQIEESDLGAVADLLTKGFAERPRHYWTTGFERLKHRDVPEHFPRYGLLLERQGCPVGVMLMLYSVTEAGGESKQRCNLSSWYVEPAYGKYTATLVLNALRRRGVTYTTISPAAFTLKTVEKVGFIRYTTGHFITFPALKLSSERCRIHVIRRAEDAARFSGLAERDLLLDHAAMGCLSLVVEQAGDFHPFVFLRFRIRSGRVPLPMEQLIFCRHVDDMARFAGPIGRFLLRRGSAFVTFDTDGTTHGLRGIFRRQIGAKYFKGTDRPRLGDLAYSERVVFGP